MSRISNNSFAVNKNLEQIVEVSGGTITPSGTQDVDVVGNTIGLATEATLSDLNTKTSTKDGFAQVLLTSAGGTAVKADTTCVVQEDTEFREGWNLTNSVAGTKFNLYYFDGTQEIITLGEVLSVYFKAFINVNSGIDSIPFIHIYTKPTGVGDAGAFYHSKIDYVYNNDNTIGIGEECVFYGESEPKTAFSNRKIQLNDKTVNGDGADSEEVLFLVVSSNSAATINTLNTTINVLGFDASINNVTRNLYLVSSENPTGLATEATLSDLNTKITNGEDDQLTAATQVLMYGRKDTSPTGLYAMKVNSNGALHVLPFYSFITNNVDTLATGAGGTATSSSTNMVNNSFLTFFGKSTNATDPILVEVSADNANWYEASEYFVNTNVVGANVNYSVNIPNVAGQYWRLKQTDTLTTAFTLIVNASRK